MTHFSPDPPVDSTLDALLTRTLGSGQLSATRKRRDRERLGLTAGAFTGNLPATRHVDTKDDSSGTRIVTSSTSSGPFRRQLELITVVSVLILVLAGVVLYQSLLSDDDGSSASGGASAIAFVSLVKEGTHEFGRVTVVDVESGNERFTVETASDIDAAVSPDSSTLYVADGWDLIAYELASGDERWRTRTELRLSYMPGFDQPSTLAVAPQGDRIFVYTRAFLEEGRYADQYEVPYWLQVVDANSGQIVASTDEIVGCGAARLSFSPAGDMLHVLCSTYIQVVAIDVETLEINEDSYLPGLGSELHSSILYRTAGSVSYADGRQSILVRNEPGDNTLSVTLLDNEEGTSEDADLGTGGEDGTVARGSIALLNGDTRLVLGVRTEIEFVGQTYVGDVDQIRVFNTTTWEEISRIDLEAPLHIANVTVDGFGNATYGARWKSVDDNSNDSTVIYRMGSDGTVEQAFVRDGESVLRMFVIRQGSGNENQQLPSSTPTPPGESENTMTPQPSTGLLIYTFDEAQEMTPFELVQPEYIPEQLEYHGLNVRQAPDATGESIEVTLSYFPTDTDLPSAMPIEFRQATSPYNVGGGGFDESTIDVAGRPVSVYRQEWEPDLDHVIWVWQEAGIHYSIEALIPDAGIESTIEELIAAMPDAQDPVELALAYRQAIEAQDMDAVRGMLVEHVREFNDDLLFRGAYQPVQSGIDLDPANWTVEYNEHFTVVRLTGLPLISVVLRRGENNEWLVDRGPVSYWYMQRYTNNDFDDFVFEGVEIERISDQDSAEVQQFVGMSIDLVEIQDDNTVDVSIEWRVVDSQSGSFPLEGLHWVSGDRSGSVKVSWSNARVTQQAIAFPVTGIYSATFTLLDVPDTDDLELHISNMTFIDDDGSEMTLSAVFHFPNAEYPPMRE